MPGVPALPGAGQGVCVKAELIGEAAVIKPGCPQSAPPLLSMLGIMGCGASTRGLSRNVLARDVGVIAC